MPDPLFATPQDDIDRWRDAQGEADRLPPHVRAFLQSGAAPALGTHASDGAPLVGPGIACRVETDGLIRVLVPRAPNRAILSAVEAGHPLAVTFTGTREHRSIQIKTSCAIVAPVRSHDACEAARQSALFADGLVEIGFTRPLATAYTAYDPADLVSIEFRAERVFTQTPGPGAGQEMTR